MSNSSLNLPVEEPSSHTDTTTGNSFNPLTKVEVPVPPPNITIFLLIKITFHINIIFYFIS